MDKIKVLVLGNDQVTHTARKLLDQFKDRFEMHRLPEGIQGNTFDKVFLDEIALKTDFADLEKRAIGHMIHYGVGGCILEDDFKIKDVPVSEMFDLFQTKVNVFREEAADHPTRKREPKGPRGRWGKPK